MIALVTAVTSSFRPGYRRPCAGPAPRRNRDTQAGPGSGDLLALRLAAEAASHGDSVILSPANHVLHDETPGAVSLRVDHRG